MDLAISMPSRLIVISISHPRLMSCSLKASLRTLAGLAARMGMVHYINTLTSARQGMVIFLPHGDDSHPTRPKSYYDGTYKYLVDCGITELVSD